jgi:hypothetical protein
MLVSDQKSVHQTKLHTENNVKKIEYLLQEEFYRIPLGTDQNLYESIPRMG